MIATKENVTKRSDVERKLTWNEVDQNFQELKNVIDEVKTKSDSADFEMVIDDLEYRIADKKFRYIPVVEVFSGDGSKFEFDLLRPVEEHERVYVYVDDQYLKRDEDYSFINNGNVIRFNAVPNSAPENIEVVRLSQVRGELVYADNNLNELRDKKKARENLGLDDLGSIA